MLSRYKLKYFSESRGRVYGYFYYSRNIFRIKQLGIKRHHQRGTLSFWIIQHLLYSYLKMKFRFKKQFQSTNNRANSTYRFRTLGHQVRATTGLLGKGVSFFSNPFVALIICQGLLYNSFTNSNLVTSHSNPSGMYCYHPLFNTKDLRHRLTVHKVCIWGREGCVLKPSSP